MTGTNRLIAILLVCLGIAASCKPPEDDLLPGFLALYLLQQQGSPGSSYFNWKFVDVDEEKGIQEALNASEVVTP